MSRAELPFVTPLDNAGPDPQTEAAVAREYPRQSRGLQTAGPSLGPKEEAVA
jgi:hypothetical protein